MEAIEITGRVNEKSRLRLRDQLNMLSMPPAKRRRMMNGIAKAVRLDARKNIRMQRTITGRAMEPRKNKRTRRKMLMGLSKGMATKHRGDLHAEVTWKSAVTAKIAYRQQHGVSETWTAGKARRIHGVPNYKAPATAAQAKALIAEGFKRRTKKKRGKGLALRRVSQKWIRENMKLGQAGLILRLMRTGSPIGKQRWEVKPAARPFLGQSPEEIQAALIKAHNELCRQIAWENMQKNAVLNPRYVKTYGNSKAFKK